MRKKQINFNELEQSLLLLEGFTLITLCIFFDLEWIFLTVKRTNPGSIFKRHTSSFSCETRTCFVIALRIRTLRSSRTVTMKSALHLVSRTAVFLCCMVDRHWRSEGQGIPVYSYNRLKKKSNFQYMTLNKVHLLILVCSFFPSESFARAQSPSIQSYLIIFFFV